jgi:phage-related tail protein
MANVAELAKKLKESTDELKELKKQVDQMVEALQTLAQDGKDTTASQRSDFRGLVDAVDTAAREAASARRDLEIAHLDEVIEAHELSLTVEGLDDAVTDAIRADLISRRSRRARLLANVGTDFDGMISASVAERIA